MLVRMMAAAFAVAMLAQDARAQDRYGGILAIGMALSFGQAGADLPDEDQSVPEERAEPVDTLSDAAAVLNTNAMTSATAR